MDNETKDTLKKVAEYAAEENKKLKNKMIDMMLGAVILLVFSSVLFENTQSGLLYGIVPEGACNNLMMFSQGLAVAALVLNILYLMGLFEKISKWKKYHKENNHS